MICRSALIALSLTGLCGGALGEPVTSALPDVEALTLETLLGDWGFYERNQTRTASGPRSCAEWDRDVLWTEFEGAKVPLYGEVKFIRAQDGALWRLTASGQSRITQFENPSGDQIVYETGPDEAMVIVRSDLHDYREGMARTRFIVSFVDDAARGGYPIEFFEFRTWNASRHGRKEMPEGAGRMLKCIPGKSL